MGIASLSSALLLCPRLRSRCLLTAPPPQRGCYRGGHPGLNCQGCCGACSTSFSGLLQPSVRCVEDLGVVASGHRPLPPQSLCGCVPLSDGDHSVRSPVGSSGRLDGLHRLEGSIPPSAGSPGLSSLSTLCVQGSRFPVQSAVLWPLHGSAGLLSGNGSCFCHPSTLWGFVCAGISTTGLSNLPLGYPSSGISRLSSTFAMSWGSWSTLRNPTLFHPRWCSILGLSSTPRLSWLLRRRSASPGCCQLSPNFGPPPRLPRACGSRCWECVLRWLTWFLEADCGCGLSSCASIVLGIVRISRLRCLRRRSVSATSSGSSTFLASPAVCLSARCLPTSTSGQMPRTSGGVPIWISRSLPACGPHTRLRCP